MFFGLTKEIFSTRIALLSILSYGITFFYLTYVPFWFSDLTYILEILFANTSIYLFVLGVKKDRKYLLPALIAYFLTVLSKEPCVAIVPAAGVAYLVASWNKTQVLRYRKDATIIAIVEVCMGILWLTLNPSLRARQGLNLTDSITDILGFAAERWLFYSKILVSGTGILVWVLGFYLMIELLLRKTKISLTWWVPLLISCLVSFLIQRVPSLATVILVGCLFILSCLNIELSIPGIWFVLPWFGLLSIAFILRTYLVECAFGLAILMGYSLDWGLVRVIDAYSKLTSTTIRKLVPVVVSCVLISLLAFLGPRILSMLRTLNVVVETRQNFKSAVTHLAKNLKKEDIHLIVIEYEDMGLDYENYVLRLPDKQKAHIQKNMGEIHLRLFLRVLGLQSISVHTLKWLKEHPDATNIYLFTMNKGEEQWAETIHLPKKIIFQRETPHERVRLYKILSERSL
jgi:hypothetical protein